MSKKINTVEAEGAAKNFALLESKLNSLKKREKLFPKIN